MGRTDALRHVVSERKDAVLRRSLEVVSGPQGMFVSGPEAEVHSFAERIIDESPGEVFSQAAPMRLIPSVPGPKLLRSRGGVFLKVAPPARTLLAARGVIPSSDGIFRTTIRGANAVRSAHLHWVTSALSAKNIVNAHVAFSVMALRTAVRDTEAAVEAVGGTADQVLALAQASRAGDVFGHHRALSRLQRTVDATGVLASADWEAVASLGPMLEVTVERLRAHTRRTLDTVPADASISDRAKYLSQASDENRLGETLQLLLVAEESVYLWQQLRAERVRAEEPEHLEATIASAEALLKEHSDRDSEIVRALREQLAGLGSIRVRDVHRWNSTIRLRRSIAGLHDIVEDFSHSRHGQLMGWLDDEDPALGAALAEMRRKAAGAGKVARTRIGQVGHHLQALKPGSHRADVGEA
ncbi:hypothetical protein IEU95_06300 [Hoyosella rhizosphaerae]|uniref:Uncharacterized protein n=1 Tax=Hoyosella rhizosphaerae TaxID=1755582 RepID=A0A916XAD4_9ACTN|nr:hypothetical protein [Hoyosella rhizosphaerae]MBN4926431.1 hypothetical protein [Hoyosella rhizosphaerae]GGC59400.1 hypothetical protein GCM10011410_09810 [Hoyosella rhizosphaerae]